MTGRDETLVQLPRTEPASVRWRICEGTKQFKDDDLN